MRNDPEVKVKVPSHLASTVESYFNREKSGL